ncbi:MAG TPA: right-handed parallel beta-helix repeat-containing protein [Pseudonocardiaceae bacterium]|nr:right-handed parallel beta-helix repeat-containing protein [Pseudonocardiaceae bacterium]
MNLFHQGLFVVRRMVPIWIAAVALVIVSGCGGQSSWEAPSLEPSPNPPSGPAASPEPPCTRTISEAAEVRVALDSAPPGSTLCFTGGDMSGTDLTLTHPGARNAPITLRSDGAPVRSIHIAADHIVVDGFTVAGGGGVFLQGDDLVIRHNTVHDTQRGGITCERCQDSIIESNTVEHVDTVGIWIDGQRIAVSHNTVRDILARDNGDADGMRFFGNGHRITDNTISDISDRGYANPPHPDCFQTYDDNSPPTFDVLIAGNTCRDVGAQCLIATGDQHANGGAPTGVASITFVDNTCASNGAQAVNVRHWPNVEIRDNKISGHNVTRGIILVEGSTGSVVIGNTTDGGRPTVDIDHSSQPGSRVEHNSPG